MDRIFGLVAEARALNSKIFSLPRLLILISLENLGPDGASYRELKAGLKMGDGLLFTNLRALKEMGYIKESSIKLEEKEMASFSITNEGKEALSLAKEWLIKWLKVKDGELG